VQDANQHLSVQPPAREDRQPLADPATTGRIHAGSAARLVMTPQGRAPVTALEPLQRGLKAAEVARAAAVFGRRSRTSRRCSSRRDRDGSSHRRRRGAGRRRDCCSSHRCFSCRRRDGCQRGAGSSTAAVIHAAAIMGGGVVVSAAGGAASWKSSCKMRTLDVQQ